MQAVLEPEAIRSPSPEVLRRIADRECNLAIWERRGPAGLDALIDGDGEDHGPTIVVRSGTRPGACGNPSMIS